MKGYGSTRYRVYERVRFNKVSCVLKGTVQVIAEKSMADVAEQLKGPNNDTNDAAVSIDGTWQREGFTSTLGVVTAISVDNGKVLDCAILSKSCKGCTRMEGVEKLTLKGLNSGRLATYVM